MRKKVKFFRLVPIMCMILLPVLSKAQSDFEDEVLDNPVPFDGGISVLITAAAAYGLKKAHENKKARPS